MTAEENTTKRHVESVVTDNDGWSVRERWMGAPSLGHFWGPIPRIGESVEVIPRPPGGTPYRPIDALGMMDAHRTVERFTVVDVVHVIDRVMIKRIVFVERKDDQ